MKLNCGPTWEEKRDAKEQWHEWFAWYPVRVGPGDCRWLEVVRRKGTYRWGRLYSYDHWKYKYEAKS